MTPWAATDEYRQRRRVCVIGAGTRFLSGISYYTQRLIDALTQTHDVSAILMRQLLPTRFYPGHARVGAALIQVEYAPRARVYDGVDWYWLPSMLRALVLLVRERPDVMVFQWWTGTVVHSYLLLALVGRLLGARIVIEFHEVLDTGEAGIPLVRMYIRLVAPWMVSLAHGFVIHSQHDRSALESHYHLKTRPVVVIAHGPYDQHVSQNEARWREAPEACCNLLYFGVIRPYKGLEDLIAAFDAIPEHEIDGYWLTIVGETWEGWTLPLDRVASSRYRHRVTLVNRYVHDHEVGAFFAGADAVVLPYHRSSASGPLHTAMSCGLPIVVTCVGGLVEATSEYEGALLVPPHDPGAIGTALAQVRAMRGQRFADPHSWQRSAEEFGALFDTLHGEPGLCGRALT